MTTTTIPTKEWLFSEQWRIAGMMDSTKAMANRLSIRTITCENHCDCSLCTAMSRLYAESKGYHRQLKRIDRMLALYSKRDYLECRVEALMRDIGNIRGVTRYHALIAHCDCPNCEKERFLCSEVTRTNRRIRKIDKRLAK